MKRFLLLLMIILCAIRYAPSAIQTKLAPKFTLNDVNGNAVILDSLVKKGPVLMTFWALWCKMCIKELDALKPYYSELESLDVTVLAINQDKARSIPEVKPFAQSRKWKYTIVLDPENKLRTLYSVQMMPSLFIINKDRKIVFTHQGYKPGDEKKVMEKLRDVLKVANTMKNSKSEAPNPK